MRGLACILICLLGYVCHRWLVLDGSLPLMFDANEAEYGFYRAVLPYLDMPLQKVVWNPHTRGEFLNVWVSECIRALALTASAHNLTNTRFESTFTSDE